MGNRKPARVAKRRGRLTGGRPGQPVPSNPGPAPARTEGRGRLLPPCRRELKIVMEWPEDSPFLYQQWLETELGRYARHPGGLSPRQYAAALLQAYLGSATLAWVAQAAGVSLAELKTWRRDPAFLKAMDDCKARFAVYCREILLNQIFSPGVLATVAAEFALLEDSLKVRIRTRLYDDLRTVAGRVWSRQARRQPQEAAEVARFGRLVRFFTALEQAWPGPLGRRLWEEYLPLARSVGEAGPAMGGVPTPPSREEALTALLPRLQKLSSAAGLVH